MLYNLKRILKHQYLLATACLVGACTPAASPATHEGVADSGVLAGGDAATSATSSEQFENLRFEDVGETRAVFRFDTTDPTRCEAHYGTAANALTFTARDPDMVEGEYSLDHQIPLEDLMPGTRYYVQARAIDVSGQVYFSDIVDFESLTKPDQVLDGGSAPATLSENYALATHGTFVSSVSSNFGAGANDAAWGADLAVDGKMGTEWSSNGDGDAAFLELNFGSVRTVNHLAIRSRKMTDGTAVIHSIRLLFPDNTMAGPFAMPDPDIRYTFDFTTKATQTVRVEALTTTGGNTGLKEVEFYGNLGPADG